MGTSTVKLLGMFVVVIMAADAAIFKKTHVYIYNLLEFGPTLTVHCLSKDDDLGDQDIPPNMFWTFSFGLDILGRTRFDCTFKWNDEVHRFPIYIQMRDNWGCRNCNWTVTSAGPCRKADENGQNDVCYHWHDSVKESPQYVPNF